MRACHGLPLALAQRDAPDVSRPRGLQSLQCAHGVASTLCPLDAHTLPRTRFEAGQVSTSIRDARLTEEAGVFRTAGVRGLDRQQAALLQLAICSGNWRCQAACQHAICPCLLALNDCGMEGASNHLTERFADAHTRCTSFAAPNHPFRKRWLFFAAAVA